MAQPIAILAPGPSDIVRFYVKVDEPNANGCRLWNRSVDANGYGQFHLADRTVKAHLVAWAIERGEFPDGLEPDHTCNVRRCIAPIHVEWVTHEENVRRIALRSEFCRAGLHRWSEQVPLYRGDARECRPCRTSRRRIRYQASRASGLTPTEARRSA
jgi:HNH endonuclease